MRIWMAISIMILAVGCGESGSFTRKEESPELATTAYNLARDGKVTELRTFLAEHPDIANTPALGEDHLLIIVVDLRPAFPNMLQTIEVLLEAGADPNHNAPKILRKAIWRREPEIFEMLLKYGADPTVVSPKKKMNMLDYSRTFDDQQFDAIVEGWKARQ